MRQNTQLSLRVRGTTLSCVLQQIQRIEPAWWRKRTDRADRRDLTKRVRVATLSRREQQVNALLRIEGCIAADKQA